MVSFLKGGSHAAFAFTWSSATLLDTAVPESLTVSWFSALKGPQIVADCSPGQGSAATAAPGVDRHKRWPLSPQSRKDWSKRSPDGGERDGEWGAATNSHAAAFHPCVQQPDLWFKTSPFGREE